MKKILFATTALVATAGVAAADVTFGGYGRFGVGYDEGRVDDTFITSRYRLQIDATAESDMGVQFGARVRIQQDNDGPASRANLLGPDGVAGTADDARFTDRDETGINGVRYFARAGGLEVGVGNIFGALEFMPGQYPIDLGLTGLGYDYTAYNFRGDAYDSDGNGAAGFDGIEFIYTLGDFSVHASASDRNDRRAIVGAYTWTGWTFALGLQDSDSVADTDWTASVGGDIGPAFVNLSYADNGTGGDHWVLAGRFDVGASTDVEAYYANADAFLDDDSYGIDFNHDMGGGTSFRGGIAKEFDGDTVADLGVRLDF